MKRLTNRSRNRGVSIIEILVSLVIGLIVVGAVLVSYLGSGKTSKVQAAYAEMNESAQIAITLLNRGFATRWLRAAHRCIGQLHLHT